MHPFQAHANYFGVLPDYYKNENDKVRGTGVLPDYYKNEYDKARGTGVLPDYYKNENYKARGAANNNSHLFIIY